MIIPAARRHRNSLAHLVYDKAEKNYTPPGNERFGQRNVHHETMGVW